MADPVTERQGEAYELGEHLTVVGRKLQAGEAAPDFALETFDAAAGAIRVAHLADTAGSVRVLNVVNSLDTPVCHVETRRWDGLRADLPAGVVLYTVSMDLPFAQARWKAAEGVAHPALSSHKSEQFGGSSVFINVARRGAPRLPSGMGSKRRSSLRPRDMPVYTLRCRRCMHETQTRLPLSLLPNTQTSHWAGADIRLRTLRLQLGAAPAHGRLL
jgi:thiol peroxidase